MSKFLTPTTFGGDLAEARTLLRTGEYDACIDMAKEEVERGVWNDGWPRLLLEAYLTTGKYDEALPVYETAIQRYSTNLRLRLLGAEVYRMNNDVIKAKEAVEVIADLLQRMPWRYTGKDELIPLGEYFVSQGEDPKQVLEICYDQALKEDPKMVDAHIASARLALDKHDDQVASKSLAKALQLDAENPEVYYLLYRAWSGTDPEKATDYLKKGLGLNPRHVPSMLLQVEGLLNAEQYSMAIDLLKEVEAINPRLPKLWAMRAVVAHLQGKYADEGTFRKKGLEPWALNPEVDHTIGKFLADHYRFVESVQYQKRALDMDPSYLPARTQLAQDLLRLGQMDEGWEAVDIVREKDPYDVSIFNLKQLQSRLEKFATIEIPGFVIRMDAKESRIFGKEVIQVLSEARQVLTEKYDVKLEEPIFVEIFPRQKEFAIRTFGLPGGEGFLGVCFGRLITANSPTALNVDSNWKAVLWHEYCHVVTLQKTKNKMPRWLSEGISVYEERQRDKRWGQSIDPNYREMILGEDLFPVSQLSGAFLKPKTPNHLQFAYYESSMVVEFWMEKYGIATMQKLLNDLAVGMPINEALARYSGGIEGLDKEFAEYITKLAKDYCKDVDFEKGDLPKGADVATWKEFLHENPKSYWGLLATCQNLIKGKQWDVALPLVKQLIDLRPDDPSLDGPYAMLAAIYRGSKDVESERQALLKLADISDDCADAYTRLIEIDTERSDYASVLQWCQRMSDVHPMRATVLEAKASAADSLQRHSESIEALTGILELDPIDPSGIEFRLARALSNTEQWKEAKRHVLKSLEESPRYQEALDLLMKIRENSNASEPPPPVAKEEGASQ